MNPKTTPKIGPPKYRAPEVEKHDSEKDPTYAFSSDVYGYGVMCFQLVDQVKKRRRKSHPHEVDFVTGLGHACCEEDPRARPTAALCLAKCREFLGETWTANDIMWGSMQPTERVAYWTTEMMDVGTFKKVAPKEVEEGRDSPSGAENGGTPTTNGRTKTHGKGGMRRRESDDDDDDDDDNNNNNNNNETAFREQTQGASSVSILPVAMEYPIKLDEAHETKSVVLAQLCMQGYALDDCERAMEELQSTDLYECLDWLEEREALRAVYNEDTLMIRKNEVEEEDEKEEEFEEDRAARLRRQLAASRLIDDETRDDDEQEDDDAAADAAATDDERSSFELGDEFDYAKYDSSNLRLTPEELYVARSRAVRVLCACATDPPSRQEIDEKDERRMMIKIENDDVDFEDEADDASLESTGMDEEDSDDDDGEDDTSEDLSAKRRAKEAKMNTRANQILNSPIRKGTSNTLKKPNKPPFSMMSELGTKKDPEVLRKEYYIRRYKMAFSFRAIVALTKLAESTSSLFFILHNGGVRAATECLRKYGETSSSCARASFALIRQFASGGGGGRGGGGEENDVDDFFSSITAKHFVQTERFHILPLLVLRAIEARMEDFDVVSDGMKCLWTLIALGGDRTRKQLLKSNIAFTIRDALAVSTVVDEQYRGRRFKRIIGCALTMCLDCTEAQELFTRLSIPGLIRAKLIEFPSIKFSGEFADLREFLANAKKKTQS